MLRNRERTPVTFHPLLSDQREARQEIKTESKEPASRQMAPLQEQKKPLFLDRAEQDLILLRANRASRYTYKGSTDAIIRAVNHYIEEAKREGYDDSLYVTYKNYRDMTRYWFWGDDLYMIFNTTLDAIEDGHLYRQKRLSDPELVTENQMLKGAIAQKDISIGALQAAQRENAEAKKRLQQTIKEKK